MEHVIDEDNEDINLIRDDNNNNIVNNDNDIVNNNNNNNNQIAFEIGVDDVNIDDDDRGRTFTGDNAHLLGNGLQSLCFLIACIVAFIGNTSQVYCTTTYKSLILLIFFFSLLSFLRCILQCISLCTSSRNHKPYNTPLIISDYILRMSYYGLIISISSIYFNKPSQCFDTNMFETIIIFCFILLGFIYIGKNILHVILILGGLPIICGIYRPRFIQYFGIDPEILDNLPIIIATKDHITTCVICGEDIKENDELIKLNCPGKHFFHSFCIKKWLKIKLSCPICRNENIL